MFKKHQKNEEIKKKMKLSLSLRFPLVKMKNSVLSMK